MLREVRMIHHHPEHDRRGHTPGGFFALDQSNSVQRREGAHDHALAAGKKRRHEVCVDRGVVIKRGHAQVDVIGVQAARRMHDVGGATQRIDVHGHGALGHAGGARGEGDGTQVPLVDLLAHRDFRARTVEVGKRNGASIPRIGRQKNRLHAAQAVTHRGELAGPDLGRHHHHARADLVDLSRQPFSRQAQIDRDRNATKL